MDHTLRMTGRLEPRESWTADRCTIARTLDVITTRSAFLILREAFYGTTRFDDFAQRAGISEPVAAARLRELVDDGLLEREDYRDPGQRTRQRYRLTEQGADLFPALAALMQWGDRWLDERGERRQLRSGQHRAQRRRTSTCRNAHRCETSQRRWTCRDGGPGAP